MSQFGQIEFYVGMIMIGGSLGWIISWAQEKIEAKLNPRCRICFLTEKQHRHARLIAQAPEMAAILQRIVDAPNDIVMAILLDEARSILGDAL